MSDFYFPAHTTVLLATPSPNRILVPYANGPINLDLVVTFTAGTELYDFGSIEAAKSANRQPFPAIRFDLPGHLCRCWFFEGIDSRDAELRGLTSHLINRGSRQALPS